MILRKYLRGVCKSIERLEIYDWWPTNWTSIQLAPALRHFLSRRRSVFTFFTVLLENLNYF